MTDYYQARDRLAELEDDLRMRLKDLFWSHEKSNYFAGQVDPGIAYWAARDLAHSGLRVLALREVRRLVKASMHFNAVLAEYLVVRLPGLGDE